ncbi:uncharacterized protein LOC123311110 [Coccinella septempunctata]|uniref:uncharacterized protein LOC123311110 n=1 Tax=Coccinella septempunctata TaxID=41139 RepID=UPI001D065117|nr:uncharacterized protein LOC123311110 [Coccinella septempunctata]
MEPKYFTLISFICLFLMSLYCFMDHVVTAQSEIGTLSFIIIGFCAFLGAWRTYDAATMPEVMGEVQKYVEIFADAFVLSFAAAEMWEKERVRMEVVVLQMLLPFTPIALYISNKDYKKTLEYVILGSLISLIAASILCGCVLGIAAAGIYAAGAFYVKDKVVIEAVPQSDLKNYVDCLFCLFLAYALDAA